MAESKIISRPLSNLDERVFCGFSRDNSVLSLSPLMISALKANPFAAKDDIVQLVGVYDNELAGGEVVFPQEIYAQGQCHRALIGAELWVDPCKRKSKLGLRLPEEMWHSSQAKIGIAGGTSQKALPVYEFLGYSVFLMPRYVMLWRSRALIEMRLKGWLAKLVARLIDCGICAYSAMLWVVCKMVLHNYRIEEVDSADEKGLEEVASLIADDSAPYSEVHDARWLKWNMTESFSKDGPMRMVAMREVDELIGFYMVKRRFHKQASHRGFKDVWLGSVVEWQVKKGCEKKLGWLLVHAALRLKQDGMDAVEIPSADKSLNHFLRGIGWRQVGESNFVIKAGEGSPLFGNKEMTKIENWRLRPAMGDAGLS